MNQNIITTSSMINNRKSQIMQMNEPKSASERNTLVGSLLGFLTTLVMLFSVGVSGAWAFNDFEIDLTTTSPVLPTGVTQISYPQNGAGHNSAQHGWYWYAIQFDVDGPVDIFLGCCQHAGTTAQLTDGAGNVIAESIDTQTPGCNGLVKYSYTGEAKTLKLYCGAYCPYVRVAKTPTSDYTATWDWTTMTPAALNQTIESASKWLPSNQDGVSMYVGAASGKYRANGSNVQLANGTKLIIPVYSTDDKLSVVGYPGMTHISIHGTEYTQDVENLAVSSLDVAQGFIEITSTADNGYLKKVTLTHTASTPAERTFEDFKIDFRIKDTGNSLNYTVVSPAVLPDGVTVNPGSYNGGQHGTQNPTIEVEVDGPVDFTIGSCQYGNHTVTVKKDGVTLATIDNNNGCENGYSDIASATYAKYVTYKYNSKEAATLTFEVDGYLPFFEAKACEYVDNVTVIYYDAEGTEIGREEVNALSALTYKYGSSDLTIPSGKAFRGWANENGVKVPEGKVLTENIELYPVITDIETASVGKTFEYDLTKSAFDPLDHDLISMTGKYHNNHGWIFQNNQTIELQVAGNAIIQLGLCQYSNESNITVTDGSGNTVGTIAAKASADGATSSINYKGAATTLTFTMANTTYVHSVKVYNVETIPEKVDGRYTVTAGSADNLLLTLAIAKPGDVIYLPNGIYDLGTVTQTNVTGGLHLIGESQNGVVIKNQPTEESINLTSTLKITGEDVILEKLTIKCRAPYGITTGGATTDAERGVCVEDKGNNTHYINVTLDGLQDTYYSNGAKKMKATFDDCIVRGNVDFFCGSGNITVNNSRLQIVTTHTTGGTAIICAPATYTEEAQGYVFNNCTVEAAKSAVDCLTPGHSTNMKFNLARAWYAGNDGIDRTPRVTFNGTEFDIEPIEKWGGSIGNAQTEERREFTYVSKEIEFSDEAKVIDKTNKPFGFVTATDRTNPMMVDASNITGGGAVTIEEAMAKAAANDQSVITLTSDGVTPMDDQIKNAIANNNIIILDGGNTEDTKKFIVSSVMQIKNLQNKTIIGINGARLCTEFFITERYKYLLDNAGVKGASTASGTGGTFKYKNGKEVTINEQEEYLTRLTLYNAVEEAWERKAKAANGGTLPDNFQYKNSEPYINAGIFYFDNCSNFVIRNLKLEGPGSVDVGGTDLMSIINNSNHFWVDHCEFTDGIDGNFDITNGSDFVTVSWCKFSYTERAYAHENSNLVGSDDSKDAMDTNHLNITYAYNEWGKGCDGRMPMARFGKIHMLNNYYTCDGNTQNAMNPRKNSEFLVEGNLFTKGVTKTYKEDGALAVTWGAGNTIKATSGVAGTNKGTQPVTVPYDYKGLVLDVIKLPEVLELNGGAVLGTSPVFTTNLDFTNDAYETTPAKAAEGLTFSVWAENAHTFQWFMKQNGDAEWTKIPDASRNSYTYISNKVEMLQLMCRAYGVSGTADSKTVTLTIKEGDPTFIKNLNANYTLYGDKDLTLEVDASNLCTYQWYKNTTNEAVVDDAHKIDGATKTSYTVEKATEAGNSYYYCVATYTPVAGDPVVLTSNVATLTAELNNGRKLWVYGYKDYTTSATGDTRIKQVVGTANAVASDCADKKCSVELNAANGVSGYTFTPCDKHYNAPIAYAELTSNSALVSTDKIKIGINQSQASSPNNEYGFYLCTEKTKSDASLVATIAIPTTAGKDLYEATINVADYFENLAGKTKFYLLPFNPSGKKVNLHEVLVLTYPAGDPEITTDIETAYETKKGEPVELTVKATNVKSYQWYKCTDADKTDATAIDGETSPTYTFPATTSGNYYVFCRAIGLKADTHVDSHVAAIEVTRGEKKQVVVYDWNTVGTTTLAGTAVAGTVKIKNVSTNGIKFANGLGSANYLKIEPEDEFVTFKKGDVITWTGCINNSDASKQGAIVIGPTSDGNNPYLTTSPLFNNTNSTSVDATIGEFILPEAADGATEIYIGRANSGITGATATWLTQLTVTRTIIVEPEKPAFTTDLAAEYDDAIVGIKKTLTVVATGAESYQWYTCDDAEKTNAKEIADATAASYDFTATKAGNTYLYCVATNEVGSTTSTIAKVSAAAAPVFTTNLESEYTTERGTAKELTVEAVNATGYHWYVNTKNSTEGAQPIPDATSKTYSCPATNLSTRYYYCVATGSERNATSDIAKVTVVSGGGGEIFKFVYDGATIPTATEYPATLEIPTTTGGTTKGYFSESAGLSNEGATYNVAVEEDMKGKAKGLKISKGASYLILQLTNGNFKTDDKIKITGYNPLTISTSASGDPNIHSNLVTGTSKTDYNVSAEVTIPADINAEKIYIKRQSGTGTGIAVISVTRAAEGTDVLTVDNYVGDTKTDAAGTVDVNGKSYVAGDEVLMTATAGHGYKFDHWANADGTAIAGATEPTYTATIKEGGITFRAVFTELPAKTLTLKCYLLGEEVTEGTNVNVETVGDAYPTHPEGEKVKVKASVATGYSFLKWTSDVEGTNVLATTPEYTYTIGADNEQTIYAHFDSQYIVEFAKGDDAAVVGVAPKKIYLNKSGDKCNLPKNTSLYKAGYTLTGWKLKNSSPEEVVAPGGEYEVTSKGGNVFEPVFKANTVDWANRPSTVVVTWSAKDLNDAKITWQTNTGVFVSQVVYDEKTVDIPIFIDATTGKFGPNSDDWIQVNEGTKITFKSDATNLPALKKATIDLTSKNAPQTATLNGVTQTSTFMSYKPKTEDDVVFVADDKIGYLGDIKLSLPPLVSGDEIAIYKSSFDDWQGQISDNKNTVTTKDQKQKVTFTLNAVTASDGGTNSKFPTASPGYLMAAKSAADITTTEFHSISKIVYYHASTGSNRGYGLKVKGTKKDGTKDADWVVLSDAKVNGGPNKVEVQVDRTDVQIQFYNLEPSQNAYMTDLAIYAYVTLAQCEDPECVKGEWDPATEKWNYTVTASLPEDATVHYCKVSDGVDGAEQTGTDEVAIKIAPGEKYKFWTVDSYDELPISNKVEIIGDAMQKTVPPILTVDPYSITGKTHKVTVSGLATGATAHYTVKDGEGNVVSGPTDYTGEFTITPGQTVEVYASQTHYANSDVVSKATTTITLPQKETFKTTGPGQGDAETKGLDNILNSAYVPGSYISGINGTTGLKYTINNSVKTIDGKEVDGIEIKVHEGYVINRVDVENAYSNQDKQTDVTAIYVDGKKLTDFTSQNLPKASTKKTVDFSIEGIEAKESIIIQIVSDDNQARADISVTYDFIDEPVSVAIKPNAGAAAVATIEAKDFTNNAYTYGTTLEYIPVVEMTTKQGYVYTMPDKEVNGFDHTFKYTLMGKEYSVKTTVSVLTSPGITVDEEHVSVAGGYPVTLSGAGTMYINIDNKKDESDNLVWEEYDPAKKYYAVKYVKSYCVYNETSTIEEPSTYTVSKDVYDYTKPFAVFVRQPSYLDSQDGSNPYNSLSPEAEDKIYQALQTHFNVVDFVKPNSTEVLKGMPDIAEAKLVVITEMISGSGSYQMQRPQDKEVLDTKSTALTMTLLRDVVDKTNVINFKMFTYSQSKNNTDRWGWAMPAALPSNVISINPVEPNDGGMYELFSEARMNLDGSITLWDEINDDKNLNHLQPVFNFNEGEHVPSFWPLAMAVDPDNKEEEYHILHYYDKENEETHKKTTYVGFGLSVNEWTHYNDNVKAIVEKIGEMIIAGRPLNTKLEKIVDPKITDNGDGSALVMNNNFSAKTYYLAKNEGDAAPDAETIKSEGAESVSANNFFTVKYTTDKKIYAVSELGGAFSNVVSADLKGSTTRYITRVTDDPAATGLEARYPFQVNTDGSAKAFDFPYNQSWKKEGYTVTKWIDVNNGTEYTPGVSVSNLTQDITVKAVWTENTHKITDLSKAENKAQRTVKWEFLQSKGAPALAMESKAGNMQAILVGQVKFSDDTWLDVPMTINTDNYATLPDNGTSYHGKFNNVSTNWIDLKDTDGETVLYEGSDYAQVRTGTQFKFPAVYGSNVVYKAVDLVEKDPTTHEANGNVNRAQISQSYITDGTKDGEGNSNYWRLSNPGFELTPGWVGEEGSEVLQPNSRIVFDGDAAQLATTSPTYEKYKVSMGQMGYDNKLYDDGGGNFNYGGLIYYNGDASEATLTSVESAQYIHVGGSKKLGSLNYGSVFMQSLSVTYPELYDLTCTWNPDKSELDPTENPGKIEKLTEARPNCGGRFVLYDDVILKLTPSYGYYVDVDTDDDPATDDVDESYSFLKDGDKQISFVGEHHIYRYKDAGYSGYTDDIKANIPVDGAYIKMKIQDIDLVVSMKKYLTRSYSITAYPGDMGVININTGNGRDPEDEYDQFPDGKTIVVTAAPKMGYKFSGWKLNPDALNPTAEGHDFDNEHGLSGVTFGTGTNENPLVEGEFLEKNELAIEVNSANSGNEQKYYAIFEEGVEGTANYQFANALEQYVDANGDTQYKHLTLGVDAINAFPPSYKSTALNIPRYYTLYKEGYTLDHWVENSADDPTTNVEIGKTYKIGTFYYFDNPDENRYLIPVFTKDPVSYDHRAVPVDITWDFRSSKFAQRMNFNTKDDGGKYKTQSIFYSTHAVINNEHLMDVPLQITLGNKGKLQNNTDDEWCAIGEGTEIVIPSGIGAKFTIASLSPMTTTSFIEKDAFGNVVNSTVPTSYTRKNENDIDVYYYTFTTQSTSTNITLKIGDDYSYYKSIRAELPAADAVPLKVTVNNPAFGGSELTKAIHTDGTSHLDQIKKTYVALSEDEGNGGVYTLGLGTTVTLKAKRNHLYVVDHFEDHFGTKYTWSDTKDGHISAVSADGTDVSATAYNSGMSMKKVEDVLGNENDIEFTFQVNTYDNLIHIVYKENTLYQINYTSGEEAEGEAPGIKLIEEGESFTVPAENHYLYVDGQTLKYWVDEKGNKYDFGQSYTPGETFKNNTDKALPSGLAPGASFTVPLDNLFLTPHFDVNDFTVMNLTEDARAVWPLTRLGKSGSDDPKGNYAGNGDVVIYFQKSVGIYVTPLKLADGRFIDLKLDMNCAKNGKIDNQNNGERCQINGESVIGVPSSSNCDISLYTVNGKLSTTVIAGATGSEDGKEGDKVVATKYESTTVSGSNDVATVTYTGSSTMVDIEFMGEAGYFYQIAATYKPVVTKLPELDYVTIDNIALGALGTPLEEKKLSTLKTEGQVEGVPADLRNSKSGNMPVVKAQATNNGYVEITPATIEKPVATLLVKTYDGVTVSVHKIFFDVTPPTTAPIITDLRVGAQYQCNIEDIDGDAMEINTKWDDVYPEGSYIYGYKDKTDGNTDKVTDKYILNVKDAGINGAIAIRFNKPMKEANVEVDKLGQTIHAEEGQTLVFSYWGLELNTNYDFIIPAGTLEDIYGNKYAHPIRINFTTVEHAVQVENRLVNFVVTHNQPVKWDQATFRMVADGTVQQIASDDLIKNLVAADIPHGTLDEGVKMANAAKENNERFYIFVPDGEYQLQGNTSIQAGYASGSYAPADNTGKLRDELLYKSNGNREVQNGITEIARDNVSITGQSKDKTIVWNRPEIEGISYTATFRLNSGTSNFYAQDMTWENRFDYKTSIGKQGAASAQAARAVVLQDRSAKSILKNIDMMSYQDTYYSNPTGSKEDTRYYFDNCTFGGYVDFLCGTGDVWLEKCDLVVRAGKGTNASNIMAPAQYPTDEWGYVFNHCNIKAEDDAYNINNGKFTLARPWKESPAATLLYTTYHVLPTTDAYKAMSSTGQLLRIHEFRSYLPDGTLVDLSQRSLRNSSPGAGSYDAVMTPSEAERYTVFNAMGGSDGYDPTIYTRQVSMKQNNFGQDDTSLSWDREPEALCYFIFRKDNETDEDWKLFAVTENTEFELDDKQLDKWFCVRAANQRGGLGEPTKAYQYKAHESYKRELVSNTQVVDGWRWSTIYLDFNAKAPTDKSMHDVNGEMKEMDDIYVYALVKVDATRLYFQRVKTMEKNCGYLIKARPRDEEYIFKYTEKTPVYYHADYPDGLTLAQYRIKKNYSEEALPKFSLMNGSVTDRPSAGISGYTLAYKTSYELGFYKYTGKQYNAYYGWLDADLVAKAQKDAAENQTNGPDANEQAAAKAGFMKMVFDDGNMDGTTTEINGIREFIDSSSDAIYDLNGLRINPSHLQPGEIYIIGGKKVKF